MLCHLNIDDLKNHYEGSYGIGPCMPAGMDQL
jgi:hypothetical protein